MTQSRWAAPAWIWALPWSTTWGRGFILAASPAPGQTAIQTSTGTRASTGTTTRPYRRTRTAATHSNTSGFSPAARCRGQGRTQMTQKTGLRYECGHEIEREQESYVAATRGQMLRLSVVDRRRRFRDQETGGPTQCLPRYLSRQRLVVEDDD